jgi:hypothetical protein
VLSVSHLFRKDLDERRSPGRIATGLALGLAAVLAVLAGAAFASHTDSIFKTSNYNHDCFDGTLDGASQFCRTDNVTLTAWREDTLTPLGKDIVRDVLMNHYDLTDLNASFTSPVFTGDAETDIIYIARGTQSAGVAWCNDAVSSLECDQHYNAYNNGTPFKEVVCHETGHAVGLTHGQEASPRVPNSDAALNCMAVPPAGEALGAHNRGQINGTY